MIGDDIEISVLAVMGEKVRSESRRRAPVVFRREVYVEIQEDSGDDTEEHDGVDASLKGSRWTPLEAVARSRL